MAKLLSGRTLRAGGSNTYIQLSTAQPQLPPSPSTSTGYTIVTNNLLVTSYASSLGNLEMHSGTVWSNIPNGNIELLGTGTGFVYVSSSTVSTSTQSGALVVKGGVGVGGTINVYEDITVNGLKIGQGFQGYNNIAITGTAQPQLDDFANGQENINIGYSSLQGIDTAYKSIAIGRYAASSGTELKNIIAIGDSALKNIGVAHEEFVGSITTATQALPVILTAPGHTVVNGSVITIKNVQGMTSLNNNFYYAKVLTTSTIALYNDNILGSPVDGRGFSAYTGDGQIDAVYSWNNNFAIGTNAGTSLVNGESNFFLGYNIAPNFSTGSYNFFLGHEIALEMKTGNANISIGGDNLVDGLDNQVNIGSVFYYNGSGYLELNADTGIGFGTIATSTTYGALQVNGGVAISDNMFVGGPVNIVNYVESVAINSGSLVVNGGVGVAGNLNVGKQLTAAGPSDITLSPQGATVYITPRFGGTVHIYPNQSNPSAATGSMDNVNIGQFTPAWGTFTNIHVTSTLTSTSPTTGAVTIAGGLGVQGDVWIGGALHANISGGASTSSNLVGGATGSIVYQLSAGNTGFISIGATGTVLTSNGTIPYWSNTVTSTQSEVFPVSSGTQYYAGLVKTTNGVSEIDATTDLTFSTTTTSFSFNSTTTASSTVTGAVTVAGGVGVKGNIYSADGNPQQNYLLYTPKVTVSATGIPPANANVGDFWFDTVVGGQLQYIQDGTSTFWIQLFSI